MSEDESDQVERLNYILRQGCKEGLVRRPQDWPGASSTNALLNGGSLQGLWFDRTQEYRARRRGETVGKYHFATAETLNLAPLPAWEKQPLSWVQDQIRELVKAVEAETRKRLKETGRSPVGTRRILRQDPHSMPSRSKRSPVSVQAFPCA